MGRIKISAVLAALTLASVGAGPAFGQAKALKPPSPDPRNIEGVWFITNAARLKADRTVTYSSAEALNHSRVLWTADQKQPPFTEWGQKRFDAAFRGNIENEPIADPSTNCIPHGMPRIMIAPYPVQIVQTPGLITMLFEVNHNVRLIHMDQPMPADVGVTQMGYSVGRWEGDTLVIETKGISETAILDEIGTPHSEQLKVTERLRKIDGGKTLEMVFDLEDPVAYARPWRAREILAWRPDIRITEYVCEENNRNWADADGKATAK